MQPKDNELTLQPDPLMNTLCLSSQPVSLWNHTLPLASKSSLWHQARLISNHNNARPSFDHFDAFFSGIYSDSNHFLLSSFLSIYHLKTHWQEFGMSGFYSLLYTSFKYFWKSKFSKLKRVRPHTCWMKFSLHVYLMKKSQSTALVMKQFSTDKYNT